VQAVAQQTLLAVPSLMQAPLAHEPDVVQACPLAFKHWPALQV
jgi:hypothetical protein